MTPSDRAILIVEKFATHSAMRFTIPAEDICEYVEREIREAIAENNSRCASIAEAMGCEAVAVAIRNGEGDA